MTSEPDSAGDLSIVSDDLSTMSHERAIGRSVALPLPRSTLFRNAPVRERGRNRFGFVLVDRFSTSGDVVAFSTTWAPRGVLTGADPNRGERAFVPAGAALDGAATDARALTWALGPGIRLADMTAKVVPTKHAASACIARLPGTRAGVRPETHDTISTTTQTLNHNQAHHASAKATCTIQVSATGLPNS